MSDEPPVPSDFLASGRLDSALRRLGVNLIGTSIGSYQITGLLGVGGMGEVYRARDTKLGRDVAIKVLPAEFASDRERLARFEREARVLASLNHPHIATIHGVEDASGAPALVMELVEGETLAERIARSPLPIREALAIAQQVVEALDAAHEHGIVHRDLKPANVKRRPDGTVKVLDFGLAKATAESASHIDATESGMILGTAAYMSPEQARGHRVDKRAASTPPFVRRMLAHCLEKDPRRRLRDIADARHEVAEPAQDAENVPVRTRPRRWRSVVLGVAVAIAIVTAALEWPSSQQRRGPGVVTQFRLALPSAGLSAAPRRRVSISRDGRFILFGAERDGIGQLYLHRFDQLDSIPIRGTEGQTGSAVISPDGEWVAYHDARTQSLKKIPIAGGTPSIIYEWPGIGFFDTADWGADGTIIFTNQKTRGLMRMPADGSEAPAELTAPADEFHYQPSVHPGGGVVVFTIDRYSIRSTIAAMRLDGGPYTTLVEGSAPRVTSNGYLLFIRDGGIWAAKFDEQTLKLTTPPTLVVGDLAWFANFDVAANGTLVYTPTESGRTPVWVDRQGREEALAVPPQTYQNPRVSPDGSRVILDVRDIRDEGDIWIFDQRRSNLSQLTGINGNKRHAIWSRDGTRIYFSFVERLRLTEGPATPARVGPFFVYSQRVDGSGVAERVFESPDMVQYPVSFTADGSQLVLREMGARRGEDWNLRLLTLAGGKFETLLASDAYETNGEMSPDGKWIAYESEESPRREVYVRSFPNVQASRWVISTNGGREPLWSRSGSELFYLGLDGRLMKVDVKTTPTFSASTPIRLLNNIYLFHSLSATPPRSYDVSSDGSRFLMIKEPAAAAGSPLVVALNWAATLEK